MSEGLTSCCCSLLIEELRWLLMVQVGSADISYPWHASQTAAVYLAHIATSTVMVKTMVPRRLLYTGSWHMGEPTLKQLP